MIYISINIKDTEKIAREFLAQIFKFTSPKPLSLKSRGAKNADTKTQATIVGLYGELGAGKTAFVQAVGRILNIKKKINSPTFVVMKRYKFSDVGRQNTQTSNVRKLNPLGASLKNLFHLDAYRLKNEKELLHLGWAEIIKNPENIIFIEWPENVAKAMPKRHHKIKIAHTKEGYRKFKML